MESRTTCSISLLAAPLAALLGGAALSGCTSRSPEPAAGAAATVASGATVAPTSTPPAPVEPSATAGGAPEAAPAPAPADTQWLKYDPATKTVTFRLVAGPFDWNGYTGGNATLTVPPGSANVINFEQNDGTPHSAEISTGTGPVPNSGGDAAIPRAYTNKVVEGLPQEATDVMRFAAPESGTFRLICGVPGHALSGMWIWYKVEPAATAPRFGPTPK